MRLGELFIQFIHDLKDRLGNFCVCHIDPVNRSDMTSNQPSQLLAYSDHLLALSLSGDGLGRESYRRALRDLSQIHIGPLTVAHASKKVLQFMKKYQI